METYEWAFAVALDLLYVFLNEVTIALSIPLTETLRNDTLLTVRYPSRRRQRLPLFHSLVLLME